MPYCIIDIYLDRGGVENNNAASLYIGGKHDFFVYKNG